jgi:hypothetical protein
VLADGVSHAIEVRVKSIEIDDRRGQLSFRGSLKSSYLTGTASLACPPAPRELTGGERLEEQRY